jgi:hypothetical protein
MSKIAQAAVEQKLVNGQQTAEEQPRIGGQHNCLVPKSRAAKVAVKQIHIVPSSRGSTGCCRKDSFRSSTFTGCYRTGTSKGFLFVFIWGWGYSTEEGPAYFQDCLREGGTGTEDWKEIMHFMSNLFSPFCRGGCFLVETLLN